MVKVIGTVVMIYSLMIVVVVVTVAVVEDDVKCLQGIKSSLKDPGGKLSSWSFANTSARFICFFDGVSCWNDRENRVIDLQLRQFELSGQVPESLQYCQSLQKLDLSSNSLHGTIPPQICDWMPYLFTLDLSNNKLSGSIPPSFANCSYLNSLSLSSNQLSGTIPYELARLQRLTKFSVADNQLTGTVPSFFNGFDTYGFSGNSGLCGGPAGKCGGSSSRNLAIIIVAGVFGGAGSFLFFYFLCVWCCKVRNQ